MIQLSDYGERVVDRLSMLGMWLAVVVSIRNFYVCFRQYKRTRGKIHIVNMAQVAVLCIHRFLYGIIPLFEISTCIYFPLLVSLWHITYILFYIVMFMRLLILEADHHSLWIKVVGVFLIAVRFADWPYELAFYSVQQDIMRQPLMQGGICWVQWGAGVIILNFVGDVLANLFLSGMFVRRLFLHIRLSKSVMTRQNRLIEHIARKSLMCLIFTFVINLAMNLLKLTRFIGDRSDAFTVYFELIESTLLVEALRVDETGKYSNQSICDNCGMAINLGYSVRDSKDNYNSNNHRESFLSRHTNKSRRSSTSSTAAAVAAIQRQQQLGNDNSFFRAVNLYDPTSSYMQSNGVDMKEHYSLDEETAAKPSTPNSHSLPVDEVPSTTPSPSLDTGLHHRSNVNRPPPVVTSIANTSNVVRRQQNDGSTSPIASSRAYSPTFGPSLSQHPEWSNNDYRMF
ncbi:hypothetical protein RO3G_05247 [Lichtheimia corymbifera JMRC:FSU:9682]|uniref:Uncharacterized protein n=1 Tax=Lichtheimia corymbifera JMRC:FSU:9682 TaxID=1263082 RepID=A0A068SEY0_9FUNG|nr:hypothetical protein RO3G_05247 [Lichtheimia corymbifera JMRC:FSU:9682]